jgi:hypothetical protein
VDLVGEASGQELTVNALAALDHESLDAALAEAVQDSAEVDLVLTVGYDDMNFVKALDGHFLNGLERD